MERVVTAVTVIVALGACGGDDASDSGMDADAGLDSGTADGSIDAPMDAPADTASLSGDGLTVRSSAMADYEGMTVYVRFDHNITPDGGSSTMSAVVIGGAFEVRWAAGFDRDTFGANVFLFVDVDADMTCNIADTAWMFFANNDMPGGAGGSPVIVEFDPDPAGPTISLTIVDCASAGF